MSDLAISVSNASKYYKLYDSPRDRLKEALHPFGKSYHKDFYALKNINLSVRKGEILGIVGVNGSGKSTLLKLIAGVLQPNSGEVKIDGHISALLELGAGFNPQFTGMENIKFYGAVLGIDEDQLEGSLEDIVNFADIGEFIHQPLKSYSSGMRARLGFALAAHTNPEILILDEVLSVGDAFFRRKCYAKMEEFFNSGKTILLVSHDVNSLHELCTRGIFLHDGQILFQNDIKEVTKYYLKYVFAKREKKDALIIELESISQNHEHADSLPQDPQQTTPPKRAAEVTAYFVEDLEPKSTLEYRNYPVDIYDPSIKTEDGQKVNVLVFGEHYRIVIKYRSHVPDVIENVCFGIDICNLKGLKVSSIESLLSYRKGFIFAALEKDKELAVEYEFQCTLPPGTYFISTGLSSYKGGEQEVINRKIDIMCFKVLDMPTRISGGALGCFTSANILQGEVSQSWQILNPQGNHVPANKRKLED